MLQMIPLTNSPNQAFNSTLSVDGGQLQLGFLLRYNEIAHYWTMDIRDRNGAPIIKGIPFVTGNDPACNILGQFAYLGIGSAFVINKSGTKAVNYPNNFDLGTDFIVLWGDTPPN